MKYNINRKENYSLATITQKNFPIVTAYITVDIHSNNTTKDQTTQLMYADALMSGAGKYNRDGFLSAVNLLGAGLDISISDGFFNIKLSSTLETFNKLLKLTEIMMTEPTFTRSELDRIKDTTKNNLHAAKENSRATAHRELRNTFYGEGDRKFSAGIDGLSNTVSSVTIKDIRSLHKTTMSQSWTCSIAGETSALQAFEKMIVRLKKSEKAVVKNTGAHQQKPPQPITVLKSIPSRQNIDFCIGAPLPITLHHPDYIPLNFAVAVLGKWSGFTGRLMSTVRELEGLTYGIYSRLEGFSGTEQGYWQITTFFAPDKTLQGLTSTFREINKLYESGITKEELVKFKTILQTQQTLLNDSVGSLLGDLHAYHCQKFTLQEMKEHKAKISSLTLDEINRVIKIYLDPKTLTISGAGPINVVKKDIYKFIKSV